MAHKKEFISTGGGFSVLNNGVKTKVIAQDGIIKGEIKEALTQGSIFIGDSSGVTSELSVKGDGGILVGNGTTAAVKTLSGDVTMTNTGVVTVNPLDDVVFNIGTTTATAETKISLEFDETTTGIGQIIMGSTSVPQVLNENPGAAVVGQQINLLHSAGAGDCDDLYGSYTKVAITGDGDSGTTLVGSAPRAYVGTAEGTTVAQEVYGTQPWAKHSGTGTITAMSGVSAALILNDAEAFEATNSINAGHFHVKTSAGAANGTVTSSNFDGVMIEAYSNVTGLDSMLNLSNGGTNTTSMIRMGLGTATNVLETNDVAGISSVTNGNILNDISSTSNAGYIKVKIGTETRYIALYELKP